MKKSLPQINRDFFEYIGEEIVIENNFYSNLDNLDQFYTKSNIAENCLEICLKNYQTLFKKDYLYIEPSAGGGDFLKLLENKKLKCLGFDIEPHYKNVIKTDFLKDKLELKENKENCIIIGNPPFGKRAKLAIDFINKSSFYANTIAFILPKQFKKWSAQEKLFQDLRLIYSQDLEDDSFYTKNKKSYDVGCVFQIWTNTKTKHKDLRIREKPQIIHQDFEMYQYNNTIEARKYFEIDFDIAIFSQGYGDYKTIIDKSKKDLLSYNKQYIFIKVKNESALQILKSIDYEKLAKDNTTIPGFRKHNLVSEYVKLKELNKNTI